MTLSLSPSPTSPAVPEGIPAIPEAPLDTPGLFLLRIFVGIAVNLKKFFPSSSFDLRLADHTSKLPTEHIKMSPISSISVPGQ